MYFKYTNTKTKGFCASILNFFNLKMKLGSKLKKVLKKKRIIILQHRSVNPYIGNLAYDKNYFVQGSLHRAMLVIDTLFDI